MLTRATTNLIVNLIIEILRQLGVRSMLIWIARCFSSVAVSAILLPFAAQGRRQRQELIASSVRQTNIQGSGR